MPGFSITIIEYGCNPNDEGAREIAFNIDSIFSFGIIFPFILLVAYRQLSASMTVIVAL